MKIHLYFKNAHKGGLNRLLRLVSEDTKFSDDQFNSTELEYYSIGLKYDLLAIEREIRTGVNDE